MPCNDVTEILQLNLNANDQFADYRLLKKSCGRAVGEVSLLKEWVTNQSVEQFIKYSSDAFLDEFKIEDETEEFLYLKHFFALKCGVGVLVGELCGGPNDSCKVESLAFDDQGTELQLHISIDAMTEKIKSCGRCQGCGSKKIKEKVAVSS